MYQLLRLEIGYTIKTIQRIYVVDGPDRHTELTIDAPKSRNSIREIPIPKDLLRMLKPLKRIVNAYRNIDQKRKCVEQMFKALR